MHDQLLFQRYSPLKSLGQNLNSKKTAYTIIACLVCLKIVPAGQGWPWRASLCSEILPEGKAMIIAMMQKNNMIATKKKNCTELLTISSHNYIGGFSQIRSHIRFLLCQG